MFLYLICVKVVKYLFLLFYLAVTVNIPVFLHYCDMTGTVSFAECEMCSEPQEETCCSEETNPAVKENFVSEEETCCSGTVTNITTEPTLPGKNLTDVVTVPSYADSVKSEVIAVEVMTASSCRFSYTSPPSSFPSLNIQNQVFRI